jgi:hypothetical protein
MMALHLGRDLPPSMGAAAATVGGTVLRPERGAAAGSGRSGAAPGRRASHLPERQRAREAAKLAAVRDNAADGDSAA